MSRQARYARFRDERGDQRWRVTGGNGRPMAGSLEGYKRRGRMERSAIAAAVAVLEALAPEKLAREWTPEQRAAVARVQY